MTKIKAANLQAWKTPWTKFHGKNIRNEVVILNHYRNNITGTTTKPVFMTQKLFLNLCDNNFIKNCITFETFPNLRDIYLLCDKYHQLYVKQTYGINHINTPIYCAHIHCHSSLNWNVGFLKENIVPIEIIEYDKLIHNYEFIDPIIEDPIIKDKN